MYSRGRSWGWGLRLQPVAVITKSNYLSMSYIFPLGVYRLHVYLEY